MVSPLSPTSYTGIKNYLVAAVQPGRQTDPTTSDLQDPLSGKTYVIPTIWVNEATDTPWMFVGSSAGSASWIKLATAGGADVAGPASATDNAVARFDGTTGKLIQNSVLIVADTGELRTGDGSAANPAYGFSADGDVGMYRVGSNTLGFAVNATQVFQLDGAGDATLPVGNMIINGTAKQLRVKGGTVADFIGQTTLVAGQAIVSNPNINVNDKVFVTRQGVNGSTALGVFDISINPSIAFLISARKPADGTVETNDTSIVDYFVVRQV